MPTVDKSIKRPPWVQEKEAFNREGWRVKLYRSYRWQKLAKLEITNEPMCAQCALNGIVTTERLQRDHVDGFQNEQEFWEGRRQTLCKRHNLIKAGKWGKRKQQGYTNE